MIGKQKISSLAVPCLVLSMVGCDETDEYQSVCTEADSSTDDADGGESRDGDEISPVCVDGVWVFEYSPDWSMDALMTGRAEIENGCLKIDNAVVIWNSETMDQAGDLVARVRSGEHPTVKMGGGGDSLDEGGSDFKVPSVIEERCAPVTGLWYGSHDPLTEKH